MATIGGPKVLKGGMVFSVDSLNGTLTGTYEDTWADVSGRGNNLTLAATTSYGDAGFWPQFTRSGAQFTRANINYAYNTSHNMADLSSCTVICWLKYTSTDNAHRIPIYVVDASGKFVFIELGSSMNYFGGATETQAINQKSNSNPGTNDGKWHQLAVVRNGSSLALKLYFDGALVASTQDNVYGGWTAGASDISVGCGFASGSAYDATAIDGYIRNVTVYNEALSLRQIKGNFNRRGRTGTPDRFWAGFKYKQIINYAYTACGYKSSSPWKSVHKTVSSTDQTTNLGDLMQYGGAYISGACSKKILWLWGASNSFPGDTQQAIATNMFTDSAYSLTSAMNLVQSRNDAATVFKEHDFSWTSGGGSSNVDKFNFHTETMRTTTFTGGSPGEGGYGANGGFSDQHYGYWGYSGGTQKITFASDTFASHTSFWVNGQQKGMSSKNRKGMTGQQGSYSGGYHFNRWYFPTDTNLGAVAKPQPNCGEENFTMGQDHQYMLGNYDGVQNNENWKYVYATDTGTANVVGLSPTAHAGQSSGQCGWRE